MTKQEFIQEAALRILGSHFACTMREVAENARRLADEIYGEQAAPSGTAGTAPDLSGEPIELLLEEVDKVEQDRVEDKIRRHGCRFQKGGIHVRVVKVFSAFDIRTVGELLKRSRGWFARQLTIGPLCVETVDRALDNLYGIKEW